jgi:hypothetical protein
MQRRFNRGFYLVVSLYMVFVGLVVGTYSALADAVDAATAGHHRLTFEEWQAEFAILAPLGIAILMRFWAEVEKRPLTTAQRKGIASVITLIGAVVGLIVTGKIDDFVPTLVTIPGLLIATQNMYDKLWQAVPGFTHVIAAIDPEAVETGT